MRLAVAASMLLIALTPAIAHADATIVAIAVTPSGDGVLRVPVGGSAAFAVAMMNLGSEARIETQADVESPSGRAPLSVRVCASDPVTAACLPKDPLDLGAGQVRTYTVVVTEAGSAPGLFWSQGPARVIVRFRRLHLFVNSIGLSFLLPGALHAATSVAVETTP